MNNRIQGGLSPRQARGEVKNSKAREEVSGYARPGESCVLTPGFEHAVPKVLGVKLKSNRGFQEYLGFLWDSHTSQKAVDLLEKLEPRDLIDVFQRSDLALFENTSRTKKLRFFDKARILDMMRENLQPDVICAMFDRHLLSLNPIFFEPINAFACAMRHLAESAHWAGLENADKARKSIQRLSEMFSQMNSHTPFHALEPGESKQTASGKRA